MQHWMLAGSFTDEPALLPAAEAACKGPSERKRSAGSCRFWFAPAQAYFCQDYTGPEWNRKAVRRECGKRHASPEALAKAANRYEGKGGRYSRKACAERKDSAPLGGTCVFNCRLPGETLWRTRGDSQPAEPAAAGMMARACDLYIPPP